MRKIEKILLIVSHKYLSLSFGKESARLKKMYHRIQIFVKNGNKMINCKDNAQTIYKQWVPNS